MRTLPRTSEEVTREANAEALLLELACKIGVSGIVRIVLAHYPKTAPALSANARAFTSLREDPS